MRAMAKLESLIISDTRYTCNHSRRRFTPSRVGTYHNEFDSDWPARYSKPNPFLRKVTYRVENEGVQGKDAFMVDPFAWPDNREITPQPYQRNYYRGFAVLMQAASMAGMDCIESLEVERNSEYSGMSYEILSMSASKCNI